MTGSSGKTTTKELIGAILATQGSGRTSNRLTNEPHRVASTMLTVFPWHRFCVHEHGGFQPTILAQTVAMFWPHIGVVTRVAYDHYTSFRSLEATAREKARYPGYFSYRDLPLKALEGEGPPPAGPSALAAILSQGVEAYDQGRLGEAARLAEQALAQDPGDSRALTLAGWIRLQRRQPEEALGFFSADTPAGGRSHRGSSPGPLPVG